MAFPGRSAAAINDPSPHHPEIKYAAGGPYCFLYAASVTGHPGALMAMGYRHSQGFGVPKACNTAALNYIEVARRVAEASVQGFLVPSAISLFAKGTCLGIVGYISRPMWLTRQTIWHTIIYR